AKGHPLARLHEGQRAHPRRHRRADRARGRVVPHVKYLLDTHTWLWALLGHARLGAAAKRVLAKVGDDEPVGLAAISLKEASWLLARGRVSIKRDPSAWAAWLRDAASAPGLDVLPLTVEVA